MEDDDVRRMLSTAVMKKDETQHRDIVGSAVEIVLRRRRRVRMYGATVSGVAVAMGATAAIWLSGASVTAHPSPGPGASGISTVSSSKSAPAQPSQWDKEHDVIYRLPGLLNPLLPHGLHVGKNLYTPPNADFVLESPSGTNDFNLRVQAMDQRNHAMEDVCVVGGVCSHRQISGGTLYIQTKNFTADYAGNSGYAPGTGKQVLSFSDEYEFVPSSADGMVIDVTLGGTVSQEHYAATPPSDWQGQWPPPAQSGGSFNPTGDLLSPDEFAALIAKPGFGAVVTVLDPSSPVDPATLARHKAADATIAAAVKPVLPPGFTLAIAADGWGTPGDSLTLTGPSGANQFSWTAGSQVPGWRPGQACASHTEANCTSKVVPGGVVEITHSSGNGVQSAGSGLYAPGQANVPYSGGDVYTYRPDDPNGTVITLSTGEQFRDIPWAATRPTSGPNSDPGRPWPPPARDGEPFNAGGALLSADQFAALVRTPGIADVVRTVNTALDPLGGVTLQMWN